MTHARRAALVVFGALVIPVFYASAALGPNLVTNGNLETASGNASIPQGWSTDKWGTITATFSYPVAGESSTKAAKVQVTKRSSGDAKWFFNYIPVEAGKVYQYSDNYSSNKATSVTIEYKLQNGNLTYVWLGTAPNTNNAWQTFTKQFTVPANAVSLTVLHTLGAVGTLTIDNVLVQKEGGDNPPPPPPPPTDVCPNVPGDQTTTPCADQTCSNQGGTWNGSSCDMPPPPPPPPPSGDNLVQNGSLENGGSTPTLWQSDYWGTLRATFTYGVTGSGGGKAAKVTVTNWRSGDAKWWFTHIPVSDHVVYLFTDEYISTVVSNVTVEFKMADGSYQYQWVANAPIVSTWTPLSVRVTVPRGAVSFTILHALDKNGSLTIDNASVVATSDAFAEGMVTFVFDDGLSSQFQNARPILNTAGFKASYGIITQAVGSSPYMSWTNLMTLNNEGNDIAGHSRTHPDLTTLSSSQAQNEIKGSFEDLALHAFVPKSFLYPVGGVNPSVEQLTKDAGYAGARGSYWGLNTPSTNRYSLYDIRVDQTTSAGYINAWVTEALADKRWLIFEIHDVLSSGGDELSITPNTLQQIVNHIKQSGIKVVTLTEGLQHMAP